eukprot:11626686-Prorocentrum_lima.AAC.1
MVQASQGIDATNDRLRLFQGEQPQAGNGYEGPDEERANVLVPNERVPLPVAQLVHSVKVCSVCERSQAE